MLTLQFDEIKDVQEIEILVAGKRRISISVTPKNVAIQIPGGVKPTSISQGSGSFFARSNDVE